MDLAAEARTTAIAWAEWGEGWAVLRDVAVGASDVAADRIGHAAMRCAGLLAELARQGHPVDRARP